MNKTQGLLAVIAILLLINLVKPIDSQLETVVAERIIAERIIAGKSIQLISTDGTFGGGFFLF